MPGDRGRLSSPSAPSVTRAGLCHTELGEGFPRVPSPVWTWYPPGALRDRPQGVGITCAAARPEPVRRVPPASPRPCPSPQTDVPLQLPQPWVEPVAQPVAQEVERQHRQQYGGTREGGDPPRRWLRTSIVRPVEGIWLAPQLRPNSYQYPSGGPDQRL